MKKKTLAMYAFAAMMFCTSPAHAASISAAEVPQLVKAAHILSKGYDRCSAVIKGDQIHITVPYAPGEDENDLKINSVLIGKTIMDKDDSVNIVRVYYLERKPNKAGTYDEKYTFVDASKATVQAYASGVVDKEGLLRSMSTHVYMNATSMKSVIEKSVGAGPMYAYRNALQSELYRLSGADETELDQILPTVDQFASRMKVINENAHTNKPEALIKDQIIKLESDLKSEVQRFLRQPENLRKAQKEQYMRRHGIKIAATPKPNTATISGATNVSTTMEQYKKLVAKYPEFYPNESCSTELTRRRKAGYALMMQAEQGRLRSELKNAFLDVESAAKVGDTVALNVRLRLLERNLGLVSLTTTGTSGR